MEMDTLAELYVDELKDLWSAEKQILQALPKMIKAATAKSLKQGFRNHLRQTREHVRRLEQIVKSLNTSPRGKRCVGMEGLLKEGSELINERPAADALDAGLIAAAQTRRALRDGGVWHGPNLGKAPRPFGSCTATSENAKRRRRYGQSADEAGQEDQPRGKDH